jgi:peptide/nickel transport system permease protein
MSVRELAQSPLGAGAGDVTPTADDGIRSQATWRAFAQRPTGVAGVAVLAALLLFSFAGPLVYRTNQTQVDPAGATQAPSGAHVLGTDGFGFDVLGRLMEGGRTSLLIGICSALLATGIGVLWGTVAGYRGGRVDALMMRIVDALIALPVLFVLLFIGAITTPTRLLLIAAIATITWPSMSRLVRAETLVIRSAEHVEAVRGMGGSSLRIIGRHIIPNAFGVIAVAATFAVADAILLVAALSFLGLGLPAPQANWGSMLSDGVTYAFAGYWWLIYPAGVAIVLAILACNLVGDALRDALQVRLRDLS